MGKNIAFDEFLTAVPQESQDFIDQLHQELIQHGCIMDIKKARSGYMAAYLYGKKTIVNYVFRKKGMLVRIYGAHIQQYEACLDDLPSEMSSAIQKAKVCKRLLDPTACNPKCSMGYDFHMHQEHYQKCRNSAFMFWVCPDHHPYLRSLLLQEVQWHVKDA